MDDLSEAWEIFTEFANQPIVVAAMRFLVVWLIILLFL